MNEETLKYNESQSREEASICNGLAGIIDTCLPEAENKIWHPHPVWFLDGNLIIGYSKLKAGIGLMFWSGADFGETALKPGTGKFKDASILFASTQEIIDEDLKRWIEKARKIQWDYKNIYKRKGKLLRLK